MPMAHAPSRSIDVTKIFKLYKEKAKSAKERVIRAGRNPYTPFYALDDVSFEVAAGETLALLGHNGSGKSTLLKCVAGTLRPTSGRITTRGRLAALLELGAGFHPDLTGRENVYLNGSILGFSKAQVDAIFDDIVEDLARPGPSRSRGSNRSGRRSPARSVRGGSRRRARAGRPSRPAGGDAPRRRAQRAGDALQQRRLAGPVVAEQGHRLALGDLETTRRRRALNGS